MKIAIIGATGLLGRNLVNLFSGNNDVIGFSRQNLYKNQKHFYINFDNLTTELQNKFDIWRPDVVINCVALVDIKKCEEDKELAFKTNVEIARQLSIISKQYQSYFIHISTDHYFNDDLIKHKENSKIILKNNYAKTKYEAEIKVLKENPSSLVVRTNIIGFRKNDKESFFEWLLNSLKTEKNIGLYTNFFTSPISVYELGIILIKSINKKLYGIYNISSSEVINKFDFGMKVAEIFEYKTTNIYKTTLDNNQFTLHRALTLGLDTTKIESALQMKMPTIQQTIETLKKEHDEQQ